MCNSLAGIIIYTKNTKIIIYIFMIDIFIQHTLIPIPSIVIKYLMSNI